MNNPKVFLSDLILAGAPYRIRLADTDFECLDLSASEIGGMVEAANGAHGDTLEYADPAYIAMVGMIGYDPELVYAPPALCKQFNSSVNCTPFEMISHMHLRMMAREEIAVILKEHGL